MTLILRKSREKKKEIKCDFLPKNYNFELTKTINVILRNNYKRIGLQLPDGLLKYASILSDLIKENTGAETITFADVVYGACCVDDKGAKQLGCDFLIHYGHSCLVPINECEIKVLYIFVDIIFDSDHLIKCIESIREKNCKAEIKNDVKVNLSDQKNFSDLKNFTDLKISLRKETDYSDFGVFGTIQFNRCVREVEEKLGIDSLHMKPLSKGEVLGCTAPKVDKKYIIFISDGRFHLEALMIRNPNCIFYRYCPFNKKVYLEKYDFSKMVEIRKSEVEKFRKSENIGIILGTLGKQGNPVILKNLLEKLKDKKIFLFQLEEIKKLDHSFIDAYVQICCPRLSIDWGQEFGKPVITPFEVFWDFKDYKMDFYSKEGGNKWQNYVN